MQVHPLPLADVTVWPEGTLKISVVCPVVGPAPAALFTPAWYVAVPGEVSVPTGEIVVVRDGGPAAGVTGIETDGALDGADCPAVVAVAVGDTGLAAPAGMFTPMLTGGKLAPG